MKRIDWQLGCLGSVLAACLVACGGGGGGGSSDTPTPETPTPTPTAVTVTGTAATGAAVSGRPVEAKCATGSGSATTGSDGSYTLSVSGGALPCAVRVTLADSSLLHSVATGTGSSARANLTPATQLVVASLAGSDPAAWYGSFGPTATAALSAPALAAAQAAVVSALKDAGVDLSTVGDLVSGPLTAGTTPGSGNAYDTALDSLGSALKASGSTLAALTTSMAGSSVAVIGGGTPSTAAVTLPAAQLLRPAAANCSALRSGDYWVAFPTPGSDLSAQFGRVHIDAPTLAVTFTDGSAGIWTSTGKPCHFKDDVGGGDIVVSQAGVVVARYSNDGGVTYGAALAFPVQAHTLAELAGTWNTLGLATTGTAGPYSATAAHVTFDASGSLGSSALFCQNDSWSVQTADCQTVTPGVGYKANSDGGFDVADVPGGAVNGRLFVYRAGNGDLMAIGVDGDGSFHVATKDRTNGLPAVGTPSTNWNIYLGNKLLSTNPLGETTNTITSLDATAQSFVRSQSNVGSTVSHPETLLANTPRNGYTRRVAATVQGSDGSTVNVNEFTALPLRGMGLSALIIPGPKLFDLAPSEP